MKRKTNTIETKCKQCNGIVFITKSRADWGGMTNSYCKNCAIKKANKGFVFE